MKKLTLMLAAVALSVLGAVPANAADLYPWNNHAAPYSFLFGNEFDTHQQSQQLPNGSLSGFFYIIFTGVVTKDGYRVATHEDCNTTTACTVGWTLSAQPGTAKFLYHVEPDHEVFLVNRQDIPEPGAFAHFHWLDYANDMPPVGVSVPGYFVQLTAVDTFCFIHDMPTASSARKQKTCRANGGIAVNLGTDIATHVNIVTSFPSGILPGI